MFVSPSVLFGCLYDNFMQLPFLEVLDLAPPERIFSQRRPSPSAQVVILASHFGIEAVFVPHDADEVLTQAELLALPRAELTPGCSTYGPARYRRWSMIRSTRPRGLN